MPCRRAVASQHVHLGCLKKVTAPLDHGHRIDKLRFDREETFDYFLQPLQMIGNVGGSKVLKQRDASQYLGVKTATVPYLMKLGLLDRIEIVNPVNRRRQFVVSYSSLDNFKNEYVPVSEIAAHYDTHTNVVLEEFRRTGIKPIYDNCGSAVSRFLRRRDIDEVTLDIPKRKKRNRKTGSKPA